MDKAQKKLAWNIFSVLFLTALFVFAMINFKDVVIKRESMRAMNQLGKFILEYRQKVGSLPSQQTLEAEIPNLHLGVRLGNVQYRAPWISYDALPGTIVAYTKQNFNSFLLRSGAVVLTLDGNVHFLNEQHFQDVLSKQQSRAEIQEFNRRLTNIPLVPGSPSNL